jgi:hypothetical protein
VTASGPFEMIDGEASLECVDGVCLVPEPAAAPGDADGAEPESVAADPA